jgi:uncharacterized protein with HEPN domain
MSRSVIDRLNDIIESAELASQHAAGLDENALSIAARQRDAALLRIAVIGEAASHLPAEVQTLSPEKPWREVTGMRNHIIHAYWQIDFRIVADTIAFDLEQIKTTARRLVELISRAGP